MKKERIDNKQPILQNETKITYTPRSIFPNAEMQERFFERSRELDLIESIKNKNKK